MQAQTQLSTPTTPPLARIVAADSFGSLAQAYRIGAIDAQLGDIACPEMYYRNPMQKQAYCRGYQSIKGATLTTVQFLGAQ